LAKPDGSRLYVACANDDSIQVFQTSNNAQVGAIRLGPGAGPQALAISTDEQHLFVACANLTRLLIVPSDENSTEAINSIPLDRGVVALVASPLAASYQRVLIGVARDDARITVIDPYQFRVRVNPQLLTQPGATGVIRKDQYDLIMNIVANFHPIGVEVITDELRQHVVEFRLASTETFPTYTYPAYRMRRPFLPP